MAMTLDIPLATSIIYPVHTVILNYVSPSTRNLSRERINRQV